MYIGSIFNLRIIDYKSNTLRNPRRQSSMFIRFRVTKQYNSTDLMFRRKDHSRSTSEMAPFVDVREKYDDDDDDAATSRRIARNNRSALRADGWYIISVRVCPGPVFTARNLSSRNTTIASSTLPFVTENTSRGHTSRNVRHC